MSSSIRAVIRAFINHQIFRLIRNALLYGIGDIVQRFLALILLPIYTRYLLPQDYGIIGLLSIFGMLLGTLTMCGLTNGISRYFYYPEQEKATQSDIVWSPFLFIFIFSLIVLLPMAFASPVLSRLLFDTDAHAYLVIITLAGIFINNLSTVARSVMIFEERVMAFNVINLASIVIGVVCGLVMVVHLERGVTGMVEAGLMTSAIMLFPTLLLTIFRYRLSFSKAILVRELRFSLPLVIAVYAFWIIDSSDRFMLKMFLPLSEIGLYDIGYNFGMVMMIIVGGFTLAWPPYYHRNNQNGEGQNLCDSALKSYLFITSIIVVLLSVSSPLLMRILTTEKFHQSFTVVPWVAAAYMLKGPYIIFLMGVLIKNKTSWQLYLEIAAASINIIGNFLLIPLIGREAAAVTTLLSYSVMCLGAYWMVMRINPIPNMSSGFVLRTIILCIVISSGALLANHEGWNYLVSSIFLLLSFLGILTLTSIKEFKPLLLKVMQSD